MRRLLPYLIIALSTLTGIAGETPREFVRRFYAAHKTWPFKGLPGPHEEHFYSPYCGVEIIRAIRTSNDQLKTWISKHRDDPANPMYPHIEADVFCNCNEGLTYFSVGKTFRDRGRVIVEAHLEYVERGKSYPWTDRVVLDRAGDGWIVADIEFARGGSLVSLMQWFKDGMNEQGTLTIEK